MNIYQNLFVIYFIYNIVGIIALEEQSTKLKAFEDAVNKAKQELESIKTAFGMEGGNGRERRGNSDNYIMEVQDDKAKHDNQEREYLIDEERDYRSNDNDNGDNEVTKPPDRKDKDRSDNIEKLSRKWKAAAMVTVKNSKNYPKFKTANKNNHNDNHNNNHNNNPKIYKQIIKLTNSNDNNNSNNNNIKNNNRKPFPSNIPAEMEMNGKNGNNKLTPITNIKDMREKMKTCDKVFVDADFLKDNLNKDYNEQSQNEESEDENDYDNIDAYGLYVPNVPDGSCHSKYKLNEPVPNKSSRYYSKDPEDGNGADSLDEIDDKSKKYMFREGNLNPYIPQGWLYYHRQNMKLDGDSDGKQSQQDNYSSDHLLDHEFNDGQVNSLNDDQPMNSAVAAAAAAAGDDDDDDEVDVVGKTGLSATLSDNQISNDDLDSKSYLYRSPAGIPLNDQFETDKNNLSHEANYKLSKIEQDAAEGVKGFIMKWGDIDKLRRSSGFNPMNEIKLKTSQRLMTKGYGPSLPSYSLSDNRNDMLIEHVLQKKEEQFNEDHDDYQDNENDAAPLISDATYNSWMSLNQCPTDGLSDGMKDNDSSNNTDIWRSFYTNPLNYARRKRVSSERTTTANVTSLDNSNENSSQLVENDNKISAIVKNVLLSLGNQDVNTNAALTDSNSNNNSTNRTNKKSILNLQKKWVITKNVPVDLRKEQNIAAELNIQGPSAQCSITKLKGSGSEVVNIDSKSNDPSPNQFLSKDNSEEATAKLNGNNYANKNAQEVDYKTFKRDESQTTDNHQKSRRRKRSIINENTTDSKQSSSKEKVNSNNSLNTNLTLSQNKTKSRRSKRSTQLTNSRLNHNLPHSRSLFGVDHTLGIDSSKNSLPKDHGELSFLSVIERKKNDISTDNDYQKVSEQSTAMEMDYDNQKQKDLKLEKYNNMKFDNLEWNRDDTDDSDTDSMPSDNIKEIESNDPNRKFSINFEIPRVTNANRFTKKTLRNFDHFNKKPRNHDMNYYWSNDHHNINQLLNSPQTIERKKLKVRNANEPNTYEFGTQFSNDNHPDWMDNKLNSKTNGRLDLHRWMHTFNRATTTNNYGQKSINTREDNAAKQHTTTNVKEQQQLAKAYQNPNNKANVVGVSLNLSGGGGGGVGSQGNVMRNAVTPQNTNLDAGKAAILYRQYSDNGIEITTVPTMDVVTAANMNKNCTNDLTTCLPICSPGYVTLPPNTVNSTANGNPTTALPNNTPTNAGNTTPPTTTGYNPITSSSEFYSTAPTTDYYSTSAATVYPLDGSISTTPNPLTMECGDQPNESKECNDFMGEENTTNCTSPDDNEVKINININAKISSQGNQKIICTNDTANYVSDYNEDRDRRQILLPAFDNLNKRNTDDEEIKDLVDIASYESDEEMNNLASGKLSSHVLKSVFNRVKDNPKLRVLWPSFKYMKVEDTPALVTDLYALRNPETNEKVDDSEKMLKLALDAINTLVDEQVRSHTCVPLRPDLQKFYEMILKSKEQKEYEAPRNKRYNDDRRFYLQDLDDPERIEQKSKVVKKLLKQYEELPQEDQEQVTDVRDDLLQDLVYLRQLQNTQERKKREAMQAKKMRVALANDKITKRLESQYTPQFLRLLKASDMYYEILPENDSNL